LTKPPLCDYKPAMAAIQIQQQQTQQRLEAVFARAC
jgi:hypothetical protein